MTRRRPRSLRPDEEELWAKVRQNAVPLHPAKREILKEAIEQPKRKPTLVSNFRLGENSNSPSTRHSILPSLSAQLSQAPIQMDRKSFGRMKKGKLSPESRIDLHGMTTDQAHPALIGYILDARKDGLRLVLVITGKGKQKRDEGPIPVRKGVLKNQVPHWLKSGILAPAVLQVTEAHFKHGGSGAYYVYLRRNR